MNKSAFLKLIQQVGNISEQQNEELEKVAAAFPYCQTAHLLLAKSAYDKGSMLSTQRLRRASSYATNRQLLKKIIHAQPVPELIHTYEEDATEAPDQDELQVEVQAPKDTPGAFSEAAILTEALLPVNDMLTAAEEIDAEQQEVSEVAQETDEQQFTPEEENAFESELAMLLTFNSLSSSSTDLLAQVPVNPPLPSPAKEPLFDAEVPGNSALDEQVIFTPSIAVEAEVDSDDVAEPANPLSISLALAQVQDEFFEPEAASQAAINYSFDEIDRLYAEDALGYWMGSSRLGEALQLKNEYTRPRPQAFHPELILEYSKTHELEKTEQAPLPVLSHQLDIIDQFLKLNPRLKTISNVKLKPEPQEDLSLKSSKIKKGMASESLATIFLKQGKVKKAIKIYEQLILKNPEKKAYFAEQIEKLQNIT